MSRKVKYSKELKLEIVKRYLKGESAVASANEYGLPMSRAKNLDKWSHRYEALGESAFEVSSKNKEYSKEFKIQVVEEYLNSGISFENIANKCNISKVEIVRRWFLKYNQGIEIKDNDNIKLSLLFAADFSEIYQEFELSINNRLVFPLQ